MKNHRLVSKYSPERAAFFSALVSWGLTVVIFRALLGVAGIPWGCITGIPVMGLSYVGVWMSWQRRARNFQRHLDHENS